VLLFETTLSHIVAVLESNRTLAIVSARRPDQTDRENLECAKSLAAAARDAGFGFTVIEGTWSASGVREWLVLVVADANSGSHLLGHCRKWMKEFEQNFCLFRNADSPDILQIEADGKRKGVLVGSVRLEPSGLTLPDGRSFTFGRTFQAASWLTGLAHSQGANVGGAL
jgi:hypothetical protein